MDFEVPRPTRRCALSGRELRPGEEYYAILRNEPQGWTRQDVARECWNGPPSGAIAFWRARLAADQTIAPDPLPTDRLFEMLDRMVEEGSTTTTTDQRLIYTLAQLLMRRKALKLHDVERTDEGDYWILRRSRPKATYRVFDPRLSDEQTKLAEEELARVLASMPAPN